MDRQLLLNRLIREELNRCEKLYQYLQKEFSNLPKGSLIYKNEQYYRFVRENGKQYLVPLGKTHMDLLNKLKMRRYIKEGLPILKKRIDACKTFLNKEKIYDPKSIESKLGFQYHGLNNLNIFLTGDINEDMWKSEEFNTNNFVLPDDYVTANGLKTRSKSESFIGTRLEESPLIFRYETEVRLKNKSVYPDFAIYLPNKRRVVYWEHLGRIDDPKYILRNLRKLEEYAQCGIYLGINLIITYETKDHPLTIAEIDRKINMLLKMDQIH